MRRRTLCSAVAGACATGMGFGGAAPAFNDASIGDSNAADVVVRNTYFGTHFHRLVVSSDAPVATRWPSQATIGSMRLWDSGHRWADLAPAPGRWDFDRMDRYVDQAAAHKTRVLYTFGSPPRWASARPDEPGPYGPGCAAEPREMSDWVDYLRRVVTRYRGRIEAYELWNEPNFSDLPRDRGQPAFYSGSVATMVEMGRSARTIIKELDPSARLFTPGFVNGPDRLALFLQAGGAALVDGVAYHFYSDSSRRFSEQVGEVRAVMRQGGVSSLPLWNTETGVEVVDASPAAGAGASGGAASLASAESAMPDSAVQRLAGARLAQYLLLGAASGIERFYEYAWDDGHMGMVDARGRELPRLVAFAQAQHWILGATLAPPQPLADGGVRIWTRRGCEQSVILWAERETVVTQAMPRGWRAAGLQRLFETTPRDLPAVDSSAISLSIGPAPLRLKLVAATPAAGST